MEHKDFVIWGHPYPELSDFESSEDSSELNNEF